MIKTLVLMALIMSLGASAAPRAPRLSCPGSVAFAWIETGHYKPYPSSFEPDKTSKDETYLEWDNLYRIKNEEDETVHCEYKYKRMNKIYLIPRDVHKCVLRKMRFICN